MSKKLKRRAVDKIKFSIGAKLISIISIIVVLSLGSITALVSWLVQEDLQISAEEHNFEMNRRSSLETEALLVKMRSSSRMLIQTITAFGLQPAAVRESTNFFFSENPQIAAVFYIVPGRQEQLLINTRFFDSREMDRAMAASFFDSKRTVLGRAVRGETVLVNAAPHFSRSLLALFFPHPNEGVGGVLFSSEELNTNFGFGLNKSYMFNRDGELLAHSDFSMIRNGINIAELEFARTIIGNSEVNRQLLMETDFGTIDEKETLKFIAYTKLGTANVIVITSIEYEKIFEGIAATTRRNIYLTIAVLSISIIFIWFFSKTISIPLKSLAYAARKIESGIFEIDLYSKNRDEIGILTSSFAKMCSALHVFGRFTNKEIAVKAMRGEIKPGGLPKHGTVFFSDIREFTAKCENFTNVFKDDAPDKIVHWLNVYFTHMVDCIEKTNGVVDKFIGDAVMAHWGTAYSAGSPRKDAFNCVKAALMMRKSLYLMNKERQENDHSNPIIRIGCGINSGIVTAGQLGSDMRMEYTVIGDPVNLASRIEALTKPLGADILISEDTWNLIGDKFITEEMPPVSVKGKEKPVRIFAVVNFSGIDMGPQTLDEVRVVLGIEPPNLSKVNVNADEKKFKINEV
jgi:adenylate cyclase